MEPVKHAKSVNFHSNVELPEKYNPELDEGTTNLFKPSWFFSAKNSKIGLPRENAHHTTND